MRRLLLLLALIGCAQQEPTGSVSSATTASAAATTTATVAPEEEVTAIPGNTVWGGVAEVPVDGARELGCVAQAIREHLRVTCSPTGGKEGPTGLEIEENNGASESRSRDGVAFLQVPVRKGAHVVAAFAWGTTSHRLTIDWPKDQASRPATWAKFGEAYPTPPSPCEPLGLKGRGSMRDPCMLEAPSSVVAKRVGDNFEIVNPTEHPVAWINTVVYHYDATGKRVDDDGDPATGQVSHSMTLTQTDWVKPKSQAKVDVGFTPPPPQGTDTTEVVVCAYALAQDGKTLHFEAKDRCKQDRPKGG